MTHTAPGKHQRDGLTIMQLMDMFPDEEAATKWFEPVIWPNGRQCPKCQSKRTGKASHKKMPYWCSDCRSYFSVKTGTAIANSKIPLRKWCIAIYLCLTSLKSISSMKLHLDLGVSQPTAWFMMHRIRQAWADVDNGPFEVDETYMGGKRKNKSNAERRELTSTGAVDLTAVVGAKCRTTGKVEAKVVQATNKATLQNFVSTVAKPDASVFTDDHSAYTGIPNPHQTVNHSTSQYVDGHVHTNGVESFWSMLKRAHKGTFHKISPKHLQRYVDEFEGKFNIRELDTICQMRHVVACLVGRTLLHRNLVVDNGLDNFAR